MIPMLVLPTSRILIYQQRTPGVPIKFDIDSNLFTFHTDLIHKKS